MTSQLRLLLSNSDKKSLIVLRRILRSRSFLRSKTNYSRFPNDSFIVSELLGMGLEIGALSVPFKFSQGVTIDYADVYDSKSARKELDKIPIDKLYFGQIVDPDFILTKPKYGLDQIEDEKYDFCFSSHSLEHHPNIIYAITEQLRVVKKSGKVYGVLPNKEKTYDCNRKLTPSAILIDRYVKSIFSIPEENVRDLVFNTFNHPYYQDKSENRLKFVLKNPSGMHHYFVYSPTTVLELLMWASVKLRFSLEYFYLENENIHFLLRKQ